MPVTLTLQENDRLMVWKFTDPWDVPQLTSLYPQVKIYLDTATAPIHTLLDFEAAHKLPTNAFSSRQTSTWNHPNSGETAVAGGTAFIRSMLEIAFRLAHFNRIKFFEHETAARAYLLQLIAVESQPQSDHS